MPPFHHRGNHFAATGVPFSGRFFGEYGRGMSVRSQSQRTRAPRRGPRGEAGAARASILAAARALFLAGDFQSVSLRAVAREAGVDTSLVSYYFGSKQALYNEAMSLPNGLLTSVPAQSRITWARHWSRPSSMPGTGISAWADRIRRCRGWFRRSSPSLAPSTW